MPVKEAFSRNENVLFRKQYTLTSSLKLLTSIKFELLNNFLRPQLSQALLDEELDFRRNCSSLPELWPEQTTRAYACRKKLQVGHHLEVGQKLFYEAQRQDSSKMQKLQQRRLGSFAVSKWITSHTYQI